MVIGAGAEKHGVAAAAFRGALAEPLHDLRFRHLARNVQLALEAELLRNGREQVVDGARAYLAQHGFTIGF